MTTKKRMLYSRKELLDLKTKSLKRLQEGKLTKKEQVEIEELLKTIDEILEVMKKPTDKTDWYLFLFVLCLFSVYCFPIPALVKITALNPLWSSSTFVIYFII